MTDFLKLILNRFGYWDWTLRSTVGRITRVNIGLMLGLGKQKTLHATHSRLWRVAEYATVAAAGGLSFRELEALSSTCETWFLTLTRARITLHMTVLLERHA